MTESAGRRVLLSHSTRDKGEVQRLRKALADRGVPAWEDVLELRLGDDLDALRDAVQRADVLVLYLTPASISSEWVQREITWALEARKLDPAYQVLPLLRGLGHPALKLLTGGVDLVSIALEQDAAIETAVPAILQALGLAPQNATRARIPRRPRRWPSSSSNSPRRAGTRRAACTAPRRAPA